MMYRYRFNYIGKDDIDDWDTKSVYRSMVVLFALNYLVLIMSFVSFFYPGLI